MQFLLIPQWGSIAVNQLAQLSLRQAGGGNTDENGSKWGLRCTKTTVSSEMPVAERRVKSHGEKWRVTVYAWQVHCVGTVRDLSCHTAEINKMLESMLFSGIYNHRVIDIFHMHLFLDQGKHQFSRHRLINETSESEMYRNWRQIVPSCFAVG